VVVQYGLITTGYHKSIQGQVDFTEMTETENRNRNTERKKVVLATVLRQELQLFFILFILGYVVTCLAERRLNLVPALRT